MTIIILARATKPALNHCAAIDAAGILRKTRITLADIYAHKISLTQTEAEKLVRKLQYAQHVQ